MKTYPAGSIDVAVVGAGHAGIEAALAAARMGCRTVCFTISLDLVGNMPCNPSIGGTAKGHLVREIDALGGEMAIAADRNTLQNRMLNLGKGPAVHSLRAQIDRRAYAAYMKHTMEKQDNLVLKQAEVVDLIPNGGRWQVITKLGAAYDCAAVILATGTSLAGKIYVGETVFESGPDGSLAATELSAALTRAGLHLRRFKTGTPARVLRRSVNTAGLEEQKGDVKITPFSYSTDPATINNTFSCYISYTNEETKKIILANLDRSPLYAGRIEGVGPRYCPSIEDKIVRFADKERHQLFIEPCGESTEELYLQGMSSSLPEEVQIAFYKTIPGLEQVEITRNAYAIEYDCTDPLDLTPSLEAKAAPGLFGAGQFNGSSGYEEAAAQGLVAGVNAARKVKGLPPMILERSGSYIGTLIDDLVTKGCSDPYRMMTSRSEYRLVLRQDNADERLMPLGRENGMISDEVWERFLARTAAKDAEVARCEATFLPPREDLNRMLTEKGTSPMDTGARLADLIRRPQLTYADLAPFDPERPALPDAVAEKVEVEIKYKGYIDREQAAIREMHRLESRRIPDDLDYAAVKGLRLEAVEKLNRVRPRSIGQASRISGVSPADISVLLIRLEKYDPNRSETE